jgi:hypothetical protein
MTKNKKRLFNFNRTQFIVTYWIHLWTLLEMIQTSIQFRYFRVVDNYNYIIY